MRLDNSYDGLTQWDTGRKIILESYEICDQIHFSNKSFGKTIDVLVYKVEDSYLADIPDELLQSPSPITVYCYVVRDDGETTTISETFPVRKRNKPTDYIYNPESQTRIKEFNEFVDETITEMKDIETKVSESTKHQPIIQNGTWFIWDVVNNVYTDTGVFAQGPKGDKGDAGEQGLQGPKGDKGDTPVKGIDYFTNEDIESLGIDGKADKSSTLSGYGITDAYTKTETDGKLDTKVDKESGKGLSANDYTNTDKAKVDNLPDDTGAELSTKANSADVYTKTETDGKLDAKVDKESGKGLSANDYTNTDKAKVDNLPDDTGAELSTKANSADLVNYVKNTDIATASELGIVKFNASFGISVNANGQPFINKAPQSVIDNRAENPSASYYPIVPSNFDYAASKSTHQDMSDNYDVSTLQVSESFEGNQGQLPVSYDASKGYIDEKFSDSTPITTASGYPLTVTDHLEGEDVINYQVYGNSTQATRSGKNLLIYPYVETTKTENGITFTDNGDGTITVNGTATADVEFKCCRADRTTILMSANQSYVFSGCPKNGGNDTYYMYCDAVHGGKFISLQSGNDIGSGFSVNCSVNTVPNFFIIIKSGTTVNNLIFKPQIEVGTTATEYEQYGVMPSPDYPSEIQSVGNLVTDETSEYYGKYDVPVKVCGKNLISYPYTQSTQTKYGIAFTDNGDQTITANGTATANATLRLMNWTTFDKTKQYYITGCPTGGAWSKYSIYVSYWLNGNWVYEQTENGNGLLLNLPNMTKEFNQIQINCSVWNGATVENLTFKPMLVEGATATEYEPYSGETKHIYLNEPLRKVGDYADYVDFQSQKTIRQVEVLDDTGTTTIAESFGILATPTEETITVPELTAPNSAVMNVSSGTATQPSKLDLTYYQDINKKLDEIHEDISDTQAELDTKANSSDLVNYVKFTNYATSSKAGVVKYNVAFGIGVNADGYVYTTAANKNEIDLRTTSRKPIVPSNLDYAVRSVYPITQTALSDPITVNTIYDLGLQTDIAIALPSGQLGDFIQFDFVSGTTATTLSVSSSNGIIGYDLIPEANNIYTLYFDWGVIACDTTGVQTYGWRCNYFEYAITLSEPSST